MSSVFRTMIFLQYQCPFTWGMSENMKKDKDKLGRGSEQVNEHQEEDDYFLLNVWFNLTQLCIDIVKEDFQSAQIYLDKLQLFAVKLDFENLEKDKISSKVVNHVILSTIFYALKSMGKEAEAKAIETSLTHLSITNVMEEATLEGLKSLTWNQLYMDDNQDKAMVHSKNAIRSYQDCGLWYYSLASCIRRIRKIQGASAPNFLERKNFLMAYEKNPNPFFAIKLALCYKENNEGTKALELYVKIKETGVQNFYLYLRLALGFIYYKEMTYAKECLDKAEKMMNPVSAMFLHYKGLYLKKLGKYEEAADCFKEAGKLQNFLADINLVQCWHIMNKNVDYIKFFEELLEKYEKDSQRIQLNLHIAMSCEKQNIPKALIHFENAIKLDPHSGFLSTYFSPFYNGRPKNIYEFLAKKFLPEVSRCSSKLDKTEYKAYVNLKDVCCNKSNRNVYKSY